MLGWSINLFRIRGIQIALHGSFLLLLGYSAWEGWQDGGVEGLAWSVVMLLAFFTCVVLHELGHSFMARRFGVGVRRILLMPIGGMAEFDQIPREPGRELLITLAGPAVNFVIAGVLLLFVGLPERWSLIDYPEQLTDFAHILLGWNLMMGLFNLVPVFPMDGGRIFRALLATQLSYLRATFWAATVGKVLAVIAAIVAITIFHAYLLAALFAFIFFAGDMEYRATKRREIEEAHWREIQTRFQAPSSAGEPPLLTSI
jgi:Zn-dependent protease